MLTYEKLTKLKEAKYPQAGTVWMGPNDAAPQAKAEPAEGDVAVPTVAMLIVRNYDFRKLERTPQGWLVNEKYLGDMPEDALADCWIDTVRS